MVDLLDRRDVPFMANTMMASILVGNDGEAIMSHGVKVMVTMGLDANNVMELTIRGQLAGNGEVWQDIRLDPSLARGLLASLQSLLEAAGETEGEYKIQEIRSS